MRKKARIAITGMASAIKCYSDAASFALNMRFAGRLEIRADPRTCRHDRPSPNGDGDRSSPPGAPPAVLDHSESGSSTPTLTMCDGFGSIV